MLYWCHNSDKIILSVLENSGKKVIWLPWLMLKVLDFEVQVLKKSKYSLYCIEFYIFFFQFPLVFFLCTGDQ